MVANSPGQHNPGSGITAGHDATVQASLSSDGTATVMDLDAIFGSPGETFVANSYNPFVLASRTFKEWHEYLGHVGKHKIEEFLGIIS